MPPPSSHPSLVLRLLPDEYYVIQEVATPEKWRAVLEKLLDDSKSPSPMSSPAIISFSRTDEEISIVGRSDGEHKTGDWRCIKIAGPMEFSVTGVMAAFTEPLRRAGIAVFALSTYNTDYILVPKGKAEAAVDVLRKDGWKFAGDS